MPYRKRKTYKRKRRSKRSSNYNQTSNYNLSTAMGVPRQRVVKLRYQGYQELTTSSGALTSATWRCNGAYDPSTTVVGDANHTPAAFRPMAQLYNHYTVLGSKATVTWTNGTGDSSGEQPTRVGVYVGDDTIIPFSRSDQLIENGRGSNALIGSGSSNLYQTIRTNAYYSAKKFHGVTDVKDAIQLSSAVDNVPSEQAFFVVWAQALGNGTANITANIVIDYIVAFSEPKDL